MCMVVYAGSDYPLPTWSFDANRPAFHVTELNAPDDPVRQHFTKPFVYDLGSHLGCGCGFEYGQGDGVETAAQTVDSRRRLAEYVAVALQHQPEVELYACWSGDEGKPAESRDRIRPADLTTTHTYFREREMLLVSET